MTSELTHDGHVVSTQRTALPQSSVDGNTTTKHRSGSCRLKTFGDRRYIVGGTADVLLEGARGVVTGNLGVEADTIVAAQACRC